MILEIQIVDENDNYPIFSKEVTCYSITVHFSNHLLFEVTSEPLQLPNAVCSFWRGLKTMLTFNL